MIAERFITRIAQRLSNKAPLKSSSDAITGDYLKPMIAADLLATPKRQAILKNIWQRTVLSRNQFDLLYMQPIERYAALVQLFPASKSHHHAYSGSMLDHGLEIVAYRLAHHDDPGRYASASPY